MWDEVDRTSASCRTSDPARCVIQRDGKTVIAIGPHAAGCRPAPDVDFIRRGNQVFRVEHDLLAGATRALAVCECERAHGCGVRDPTRSFGYVLPRGLRYAGTQRIAHAVDDLEVTYRAQCTPVRTPP